MIDPSNEFKNILENQKLENVAFKHIFRYIGAENMAEDLQIQDPKIITDLLKSILVERESANNILEILNNSTLDPQTQINMLSHIGGFFTNYTRLIHGLTQGMSGDLNTNLFGNMWSGSVQKAIYIFAQTHNLEIPIVSSGESIQDELTALRDFAKKRRGIIDDE